MTEHDRDPFVTRCSLRELPWLQKVICIAYFDCRYRYRYYENETFRWKISVNANIFTGHRKMYALLTRRPGSDTHYSLLQLNDSFGFAYLKTNDENFEKVILFGETRGAFFKRDSIESIEVQIFTIGLPSNRFLCNVEIPESRQGAPKKHVESRNERNDRSMERQRASPCPGHKSRPFFALEGPT